MPTVVEDIPQELRAEVDAAVAWLSKERGQAFQVTGIVDPAEALALREQDASSELPLGLVLCDGDLCVREQVRVTATDGNLSVSLADANAREAPPPELDPRSGVRRAWLTEQLAANEFLVLVFYRGFW